ncbi:hypothetical protein EBU94_04705 [bacterium]|nr:hypothetical protein [bacterium]
MEMTKQQYLDALGVSILKTDYNDTNVIVRTRDGKPIGINYDTDLLARERFDFSKLKKIGEGSDRVVFDLGDNKVLKVAKTARGLEQNMFESDYYLSSEGISPETFEVGLNYVVKENVPRAKSSDVITTYDPETLEENGESTVGKMIADLKKFSQKDFDYKEGDLQDVIRKYGFDTVLSYEVLYNDFNAIRNWGYDAKNKRPVHIDGGTFGGVQMIESFRGKKDLEDADFREFYQRSKQLKKEFGDKDKFTKFPIVKNFENAFQSASLNSVAIDSNFTFLIEQSEEEELKDFNEMDNCEL